MEKNPSQLFTPIFFLLTVKLFIVIQNRWRSSPTIQKGHWEIGDNAHIWRQKWSGCACSNLTTSSSPPSSLLRQSWDLLRITSFVGERERDFQTILEWIERGGEAMNRNQNERASQNASVVFGCGGMKLWNGRKSLWDVLGLGGWNVAISDPSVASKQQRFK